MCRKETGSAFGTVAVVRPKDFRFVRGEELVQIYRYPPDGTRAFCRVCGSKAPLRLLGDTIVIIPAGMLDDDPGVARRCTSSRARRRPGGRSSTHCRVSRSGFRATSPHGRRAGRSD